MFFSAFMVTVSQKLTQKITPEKWGLSRLHQPCGSLSLWNRFTGGNWEILEVWARGCWKWSLMGDSGRSSEGTGCQEKEGGRGQP